MHDYRIINIKLSATIISTRNTINQFVKKANYVIIKLKEKIVIL